MNALYQKIKELKAEFKERNNEFWQESQAWKEQQKEERKERLLFLMNNVLHHYS